MKYTRFYTTLIYLEELIMEERHELTKEIFGYCLIIAVVIWGVISLLCHLITPDELSTEDQEKYQTIATQYYETGEYECEDNILVTQDSPTSINVVDSNRPFSPSLIFRFSDEGVKVEPGVNLNFFKVLIPILLVCIIIMMVIASIVWIISLFLFP